MISPRSVRTTLQARGVKLPAGSQVEAYVRGLDDAGQGNLLDVLRRIEMGVDQPMDIQELLDAIAAVSHESSEQAMQSTSTEGSSRQGRERGSAQTGSPGTAKRTDLALLRANGVNVWASSAALKFELAPLGPSGGVDADEQQPPRYTVQIEGAKKVGGRYDWGHKTIFQLTLRELPLLAAFFFGYAGKLIEFSNHGPNTDKALRIEDQGSKFFCRLTGGSGPLIALPIDCGDADACAAIVSTALALNRRHCPTEMQLVMLRRVGEMHMHRVAGAEG